MSKTMEQFKSLMTTVDELRNKQKLLIEDFEKSTCELSGAFHWIVQSALDNRKSCMLSIDTCPPLYAEALKNMGFKVIENRNCFDTLCGYEIFWE